MELIHTLHQKIADIFQLHLQTKYTHFVLYQFPANRSKFNSKRMRNVNIAKAATVQGADMQDVASYAAFVPG